MKEFRFLDQKRQTTGLSADESTRYAQLRDLVGPETAVPPRAGFDVNAAAVRLRESLLPGGLRGQVPGPPPEPEPEPAAAPALTPEAAGLEASWADQPFAPLDTPPAPDPLFDPASLGAEVRPQAWNPEAPGYHPDAPYDEAAWIAAGYDPTATYDWSASGYGPDGQPLQAEGDPAAGLSEPPLDVPPDTGWPAEAVQVPEPDLTSEAEGAWAGAVEPVPEPELPFDPNAPFDHSKWFGRPAAEGLQPEAAAAPAFEAAFDPAFEPDRERAAELAPGLPAPVEFDPGEPILEAVEEVPPSATAPESPEIAGPPAAATPETWFDETTEPPPAPALAFGEYDGDARGLPAGLTAMMAEPLPEPPLPGAEPSDLLDDGSATPYEPAPAHAAFGEYDETATSAPPLDPALAAMLSFDPGAASAIEPGALPEGYEPGALAVGPDALPPPPLAGYDDPVASGADPSYGGPEGDTLPGGTPLELGEPLQDWQPEQALEQGFELASDGSFGELERPALTPVPGWASGPAAPPAGSQGQPALDLAAPFELGPELAAREPELLAEELPTLAGEDILEELSPAEAEPEAAEPPVEVFDRPLEADAPALDLAAEPEPVAPPPELDAAPAAFVEPAAFEPPPAAEAPFEGEIPPEIAAAFGDAPPTAEPFAPAQPFATAAGAGQALPEPFEPAASALFSEPPPAAGPSSGAGEPEPVLEEVLPPLQAEAEPESIVEPEPLPEPGAAPQVWIEGSHRVVLHTVDGQVKRGLLVDAALDAPDLTLQPQGPGLSEAVPSEGVKAIFFMLAPGEKAAAPVGKKVRVTFRDGRQVAGYSPDYQEGTIGFFMIPADTRTNTGRIWVYQAAVRQVTVS